MAIEVRPFEKSLVPGAAELLARESVRLAGTGAVVPESLADPARVEAIVAGRMASGPGLVAMEGGRLRGFLGADGGSARARLGQHAADVADVTSMGE